MALKTEMNKVDVIVDGRSVAGMYQVVHHRYETISTTTAVVPRSADDPHHHQVSTALLFFTHCLGMNYYINFLGGIGSNGFHIK